MRPRIAITTGEPAGIGPEISIAAVAAAGIGADITLIGDRDLLTRSGSLNGSFARIARIEHVAVASAVQPGVLDVRNAAYVLATLDRAIDGASSGEFDAIVTAPLQKSVINDAGHAFTGHTEYFAARAAVDTVVMLLAGQTAHGPLRVALATTHLPLASVAAQLTQPRLEAVLRVLLADLQQVFGIEAPRVAVTGLNPHAGESGHLGREEIDVIAPVIARLQQAGYRVEGPLPADTVFVPARASGFDAILAMFHDQGLPVLKYATFGRGVNVTLGLPFIRTSVDHGTALDLAGSGRADCGSMRAALELAVELAGRRATSAMRRRAAG